jgi:hypothetical protein
MEMNESWKGGANLLHAAPDEKSKINLNDNRVVPRGAGGVYE